MPQGGAKAHDPPELDPDDWPEPGHDVTDEVLDAYEATRTNGHRPRQQTGTRVPPHNLDAEASLLGACLLNPDAIDQALEHGVTAVAFYQPAHGHIWAAVAHLHGQAQPVDPVTVADHLQRLGLLDSIGGGGALADLEADVPSTSNAGHYARLVLDRHRMRRLISAGHEIAQLGYDTPDNIDHAETHARDLLADAAPPSAGTRLEPGDRFLLDQPEAPPAIWGRDNEVLWAEGETFMLVGPTGVGKTTLFAQVLAGRLGLVDELLGWPVRPGGRILYIAADRPSQISRALRRTLGGAPRDVLAERLVFWKGPPPHDIGQRPETLLELARQAGADTVFVDSLKDCAVKLNDPEAGGNINRAFQLCSAEGVDLAVSHHLRKPPQGAAAPKTLDEMFGSGLFGHGAGSVILLWGQPGDLVVELRHPKQPMEQVGPLEITHDHEAGRTEISRGFDLIAYLRHQPGSSITDVARQMFEIRGEVKANDRKKAERRIRSAQAHGLVTSTGQETPGRPSKWYLVDRHHTPDKQTPTLADIDPEPF